ncbi:hypothetical protein [Haloglycomyces albus]|uniref:hypothetical protein n=1 Tax=Haloglycomyces albus TaxID=526067 RepID=UPI00046D064C|nr:hypothetical protein [Haloglycomyces albus]
MDIDEGDVEPNDESSGNESPTPPIPWGKTGLGFAVFFFVLYLSNQNFADFVSQALHEDVDGLPEDDICIQRMAQDDSLYPYVQVPCWSAATKQRVVWTAESAASSLPKGSYDRITYDTAQEENYYRTQCKSNHSSGNLIVISPVIGTSTYICTSGYE